MDCPNCAMVMAPVSRVECRTGAAQRHRCPRCKAFFYEQFVPGGNYRPDDLPPLEETLKRLAAVAAGELEREEHLTPSVSPSASEAGAERENVSRCPREERNTSPRPSPHQRPLSPAADAERENDGRVPREVIAGK